MGIVDFTSRIAPEHFRLCDSRAIRVLPCVHLSRGERVPNTGESIMFRKLILTAVLAVTTVTGFALTVPEASAQPIPYYPPFPHRRHHVHYEVLIRHRGHWDVYATYHNFEDAQRAAWRLRDRGFDVRVE